MNVSDLIDQARYPLDSIGSPARATAVAEARRQIARRGAAEVPGCLSLTGLEACLAEARDLAQGAYVSRGLGTAYLEEPGPQWPSDHPRAARQRYAVGVVACDQFPDGSAIRALYEWQALMEFVAKVLELPIIHRYADPLGALNLAVMTDGDELQWHYDQTDFVVSLALQGADGGGDFEVAPRLRSAAEENYAAVAGILNGERTLVQRLPMTPGTLLIFAGRNSLHRVSPIRGATPRLVALFGYDALPGVRSTPHLQLNRYGRIAPDPGGGGLAQ
jgi:hypothetical protein